MKRWMGINLVLVAVILGIMMLRGLERPDAVTGATPRAYSRATNKVNFEDHSSASSSSDPVPGRNTAPAVAPTENFINADPAGAIYTSSSGTAKQVSGPLVSDGATQGARTFTGKVESVSSEGLASGVRQRVVLTNQFGEEFSFTITQNTQVYDSEGTDPYKAMVSVGAEVVVKYAPHDANEATTVKVQ